ncbi:zf-HC2 domain-containing protein [Streptomyces olivoreticuli]|uniref:anti-sigma factor family protein n=1 Tax=Streptomyces olivoreticuli TaxID=68246 RepID=UPI000E2764A9|nr:zf-HC2 domain-containing protein [Streptomyces olivoreticuli]
MTGSGGQSPAEHHLGDRLAALVDGELGHDSRERVLAHLATCWKCKAEADAQRRLKSVFAEAAAPPLSDALLARLQNLPGTGPGGDGAERPRGEGAEPGPDGRGRPGGQGKGGAGTRAETFALFPAVAPWQRDRGFRIHDFPDASRGASRGRRFAFAAAGAVSLAAFALGSAQPLASVGETTSARSEDPRVATAPLALTPGVTAEDRRALALTLAGRDGPGVPGAPAAPAAPAAEVSLLRPSGAALFPPLIRAALPAPGLSTADSAPISH